MDISLYDGETARLINKVLGTVYNPRSHVFSHLRKLKEVAESKKDSELMGFACYHSALACYARGRHKEVLGHLKSAISNLVDQEDKSILAGAYNIFAIEAKINGCYEVALDYYLSSHYLVDENDGLAYALTGANIADLLAQMGEYQTAFKYTKFIKQAINIFEKDKDRPEVLADLITSTVNLGIASLNNNKYEEALEIEAKLDEMGDPAKLPMGELVGLYCLIFRIRLAIAANEKEKIDLLFRDFEKKASYGALLSELMQDIVVVIRELIEIGDLELADKLLNMLDDNAQMNAYSRLIFLRLRAKYYEMVGDKKSCMQCCENINQCLQEHTEMQNFIYHESITLMEMLENLRREEEKIRLENVAIQKSAETDFLTGIPNRYAIDRYLEFYFSEAKKNQVRLGIGIIDIDEFKKYNDTYGHAQGDECLIGVAKALETVSKKHGLFVGRYGGDEFILIYYDLRDKEINAIEKDIMNAVSVDVTHGFCNEIPNIEAKVYDYLAQADSRLYDKKLSKKVEHR